MYLHNKALLFICDSQLHILSYSWLAVGSYISVYLSGFVLLGDECGGHSPLSKSILSLLITCWSHHNSYYCVFISLSELKYLERLDLRSNRLEGDLPHCIYKLTSLRWLDIQFNHRLISLHEDIIYMSSLEDIHIAYCQRLTYPCSSHHIRRRYTSPESVAFYYQQLAKEKGVNMKTKWHTWMPI